MKTSRELNPRNCLRVSKDWFNKIFQGAFDSIFSCEVNSRNLYYWSLKEDIKDIRETPMKHQGDTNNQPPREYHHVLPPFIVNSTFENEDRIINYWCPWKRFSKYIINYQNIWTVLQLSFSRKTIAFQTTINTDTKPLWTEIIYHRM